jgi:hypothetical protein
MDERDKEIKEDYEERRKVLEDIKERIHELSMGQKILATREEMSEEITGQCESAIVRSVIGNS